jgi:Rps23 Pro-64 3,4-dihydroxylase Tpa1-like proline 4-hydroxylase
MQATFATEKIAVYDNVLPADAFQDLWVHVQNEQYQIPSRAGNWIKVWRLNDGISMSTKESLYSNRPFNSPIDQVFERVIDIARRHPSIVEAGEAHGWRDISLRSYLYPRGCKLSWHDDTGIYCGEFAYYTHPRWGSTWGGELLIAETEAVQQTRNEASTGPYLDHEWEDRFVLGVGAGTFVSPKPNRLVLMAEGLYHSINRVDPDAGDHVRCSITGFFKRSAPPNP